MMRVVIDLTNDELQRLIDALGDVDVDDEDDVADAIHTILKEMM